MSRTTRSPIRASRASRVTRTDNPSRAPKLTKAQLRELERELRRERAKLERTLARTPGAATPLLARRDGFQALPDTDGGLPAMLESRTLGRHETLVEALRRLEAGTYGLCLGCSERIPFGRLSVMPEVTYCITCGSRA
jgi:RNA polymerase-binding transcription factor DksA